MSLSAFMKYLDVLVEAGLVSRTKAGRTVACRLNAEPMEEAMQVDALKRAFEGL